MLQSETIHTETAHHPDGSVTTVTIMGTSKNLPFCFSTKSKRAMCGASPHTPTSKNIVFRGSLMKNEVQNRAQIITTTQNLSGMFITTTQTMTLHVGQKP